MLNLQYKGSQINIKRTCQGLVWPSETQGWCVVIGEEQRADERNEKHMYVLDEIQANNIDGLITRCLQLKRKYNSQAVYARRHAASVQYLDVFNLEAGKKGTSPLYVHEAPYTRQDLETQGGLIEFHLNIIRKRLSSRHKTLHLLNSRLAHHLLEINRVAQAKDTDYPGPASLGYAVAGMIMTVDSEEQDQMVQDLNDSLYLQFEF